MTKAGSSRRETKFEKKKSTHFRDWLIEKVSQARWINYQDDTDEEIAKRIGVQIDVLVDARKVHRARVEYERLPHGQRIGHKTLFGRRHAQYIYMDLPKVMLDEFKARARHQKLDDSVLLRSIVHLVLQTPTQPAWLKERRRNGWIFRGEWLGCKDNPSHPHRIVTNISEGASAALRRRAERTHVSINAICRWGICLYLNDQLPRLKIVPVTHLMYKHAEQYCVSPRITE